jgi:hypothetical protein
MKTAQQRIANRLSHHFDEVNAREAMRLRQINELEAENAALEQRVREWIPVSDQLPEMNTPVLAIVKSARSYLTTAMRIYDDDAEGWLWAQLCTTYNPDLCDASEYQADDDYHYTHWMPLPEPPQQEKG